MRRARVIALAALNGLGLLVLLVFALTKLGGAGHLGADVVNEGLPLCEGVPIGAAYPYAGHELPPWECQYYDSGYFVLYSDGCGAPCVRNGEYVHDGEDYGSTCLPVGETTCSDEGALAVLGFSSPDDCIEFLNNVPPSLCTVAGPTPASSAPRSSSSSSKRYPDCEEIVNSALIGGDCRDDWDCGIIQCNNQGWECLNGVSCSNGKCVEGGSPDCRECQCGLPNVPGGTRSSVRGSSSSAVRWGCYPSLGCREVDADDIAGYSTLQQCLAICTPPGGGGVSSPASGSSSSDDEGMSSSSYSYSSYSSSSSSTLYWHHQCCREAGDETSDVCESAPNEDPFDTDCSSGYETVADWWNLTEENDQTVCNNACLPSQSEGSTGSDEGNNGSEGSEMSEGGWYGSSSSSWEDSSSSDDCGGDLYCEPYIGFDNVCTSTPKRTTYICESFRDRIGDYPGWRDEFQASCNALCRNTADWAVCCSGANETGSCEYVNATNELISPSNACHGNVIWNAGAQDCSCTGS